MSPELHFILFLLLRMAIAAAFVVTASVITTVPMILLFFAGQRYFVQGIATTGSKG